MFSGACGADAGVLSNVRRIRHACDIGMPLAGELVGGWVKCTVIPARCDYTRAVCLMQLRVICLIGLTNYERAAGTAVAKKDDEASRGSNWEFPRCIRGRALV